MVFRKINHVRTGPFTLIDIDDTDSTYLKLTFDDNPTPRKMAKGGKWPPYLAVQLREKATKLIGKEVFIVTSQTTKNWDPKRWLCDIRLPDQELTVREVEKGLGEDPLWIPAEKANRLTFIEYTFVQDKFRQDPDMEDPDLVEFEDRVSKEFEASWQSSKHARMVDASLDIRRFRIGKGKLSKRQGYRVTAFTPMNRMAGRGLLFFS